MSSHTPLIDARRPIRRLFRNMDGFEVPEEEERKVRKARSSDMYGEIMPTATMQLLEALQLGPQDVFYDLGSGIGKVVLQTAMSASIQRCVGIELVETRHIIAEIALERARAQELLQTERCEFYNEDFMGRNLSDATVVYTCSTAFSTHYLTKLSRKLSTGPKGMKFVSLEALDTERYFTLIDVMYLDMSWRRRAKVHIYRLDRLGP